MTQAVEVDGGGHRRSRLPPQVHGCFDSSRLKSFDALGIGRTVSKELIVDSFELGSDLFQEAVFGEASRGYELCARLP